MRFKRFLMAVVCVASLAVFVTGCEDLLSLIDNGEGEDEEYVDQEGEYPTDKPSDDPNDLISVLWKKFEEFKTGIYTYQDNGHTVVVAKGTDNSAFVITDATDYFCYYPTQAIRTNALPSGFSGFDADRTHYKFVYGQPMLHADTYAVWQGVEWTNEMIYKLVDQYPNRRAMFEGEGAGTLAVVTTHPSSDFTKIDDAGTFEETYIKIINRYQAFSNKVGVDKLMPQTTVWWPKSWCTDLYPDEMNAKKHVIPYTGKGDIYWMKVNRWMPTGSSVPNPYPCYVDYVEYIEVYYENVSEEDARAYIAKLKKEGLITRIHHDEDFSDEVDGKAYQNIWFEADGQDLGAEELGHTYFYPGYEVSYIHSGEEFRTLLIKFTTNYTTIR